MDYSVDIVTRLLNYEYILLYYYYCCFFVFFFIILSSSQVSTSDVSQRRNCVCRSRTVLRNTFLFSIRDKKKNDTNHLIHFLHHLGKCEVLFPCAHVLVFPFLFDVTFAFRHGKIMLTCPSALSVPMYFRAIKCWLDGSSTLKDPISKM